MRSPRREPFGHEGEHLPLARRQLAERVLAGLRREERRDDLRIQRRPALADAPGGIEEVVHVEHTLLEQGPEAARPDQLEGVAGLDVLREDEDCGVRVVASDVGGIPEVVADRQTGLLVHYDASDAAFFEQRLADGVNSLVAEPEKARQYGQAGRQRCIQEFSWAHIAEQTLEIYRKVSS